MKISVAFEEKNGKKYYKQHKTKYHLENESALMDIIPNDTPERMRFYYCDHGAWIFDTEAYEEYLAEVQEKQQEAANNDTIITQQDMLVAMMELAQQISDMETEFNQLKATVGGE
ncbi:MAG: hypothetical protein IJO85_07550 [Lachnospiraceae bacterium]|nr:hypothetical protein [Lachnospiraceae bacterium]